MTPLDESENTSTTSLNSLFTRVRLPEPVGAGVGGGGGGGVAAATVVVERAWVVVAEIEAVEVPWRVEVAEVEVRAVVVVVASTVA
jgi:hypothetical protein